MRLMITTILFTSLLFSAKISPAAEQENPPIASALYTKKTLEEIKSLVKNNADVNEKDAHNKTALMLVAEKNRLDVVYLLLEARANINDVDKTDQTALFKAEARNHKEMAAILKKKGGIHLTHGDDPTTNAANIFELILARGGIPLIQQLLLQNNN